MYCRIGLLVMAIALTSPVRANWSTEKSTYRTTRKLLLSMKAPGHDSDALAQLFHEADVRAADFVRALDDPDLRVNLGTQLVIMFVGNPSLSVSLDAWLQKKRGQGVEISLARADTPASPTYLDGTKRSLPNEVLKRLHQGRHISARTIAFNSAQQAALILVVYGDTPGNVFTSGYYVVVRREGERWRVAVNTNAWET